MSDSRFLAGSVFLVALVIYTATLCPTVYVGDSGEFITNAYTLGINHPTGYPLFTLLARAAIVLFGFWTPAYAANFLSALCAALAAALMFLLLQKLTGQRWLAVSLSLLYAFSYTLWSRATSAEVYSLNALAIVAALYFLFAWYERPHTTPLFALAFIAGVGLSQHVTGVLIAMSIAVLVVLRQPRLLIDVKTLGLMLALFAVGFSTYLYLPIRSLANPPIDWGNPETLQHIKGHFFPRSASALFGEFGGRGAEERASWIIEQALTKELWYFSVFSILGLVAWRKQWRLLVFVVLAVGSNVYFTLIRKLPLHADFDAYFMPTYIVMVILMAVGMQWLAVTMEQRWKRRRGGSLTPPRLVGAVVLVALPATVLKFNYWENDKSQNYFAEDFGKNLLATVKPNAILFTVGDEQTFLSWYFKYVEKLRPDITVVDRNLLGAVWGASHMYNRELNLPINERSPQEFLARQIIQAYIGKRPIQFTHRLPWKFVGEEYDVYHNGMTIEVLEKGTPIPPYIPTTFTFQHDWATTYFDARCKLIVNFYPKELIDNAKFWYGRGNKDAALRELQAFMDFPLYRPEEDLPTGFLMMAQLYADQKELGEALALADSAAFYEPTDWRVYEQRGNYHFLLGDSAKAMSEWKQAIRFNPAHDRLKRNVEILERQAQLDSLLRSRNIILQRRARQ